MNDKKDRVKNASINSRDGHMDIHHRELDTILKFSALINSSLRIEDVLNYAMKYAEEFMDAEASTVYELDKEKNQLFIRMARGEKKEPIQSIRINLGEGVAGRVVQTGQPMVIQDVSEVSVFSKKYDEDTGFRTRSMICVPLMLRDKPIGALQVLNKRSGASFTNEDQELLTGMSQQIAVALDNAKLYRRLEKRFELTAEELKVTQERLIRSERLAAMGNLVKGVAHEIRNPITTIGGFSSRLKKELDQDEKGLKYIDIILQETERLENIVREVNEFTEVQSALLAPGRAEDVLREVADRFREQVRQQGVLLNVKIDDDLGLIPMDEVQLAKAFFNVMENALECMPGGGELSLEATREKGEILTRISDTGCGIDQEDLDSVYDPFFTSKTRGAGLGLTMVHQIMMNHDGEIKIQSRKGAGTTVILRLPAGQ
jgi:signal transduction histidine kinase